MENEIVRSPCISYCKKNKNGICEGCYRSVDEIRNWLKMSNEERRQVLKNCDERIEALPEKVRKFVRDRNKIYQS